MQEPKKLYRSRRNRMIGGVCGGIGEYFGIDPTLIRIAWLVLTILGGVGFIAYILALIIIPDAPIDPESVEPNQNVNSPSTDASLIAGIALIVLGVWFLLRNYHVILPPQLYEFMEFIRASFWPTIIILLGILIVLAASRGERLSIGGHGETLNRSRTDRRIAGVAGGLANYFGVDSTWVRIIFALLFIMNFGTALIAYIIAAIIIPEEPPTSTE